MDQGCLQVVHALVSPREAHHGYEQRNVPKEDEPVGALRWHIQVLHLTSTSNCQAHRRPCTFQVTVDQVVDDHACCRADDQRDQKDRHLVVELIAHHRLAEDQDRAFLGLVDWYVQSQGHH